MESLLEKTLVKEPAPFAAVGSEAEANVGVHTHERLAGFLEEPSGLVFVPPVVLSSELFDVYRHPVDLALIPGVV